MILYSPLIVPLEWGKKPFILNLNHYRNAHHMVLDKAKKNYKAVMAKQIQALPKMRTVEIHYKLYPGTKKLTDIGNIKTVHQKFFEDALVAFGRILDDNYLYVVGGGESFGCVDKENPRVEILIRHLS
jgi:hypothetical protein